MDSHAFLPALQATHEQILCFFIWNWIQGVNAHRNEWEVKTFIITCVSYYLVESIYNFTSNKQKADFMLQEIATVYSVQLEATVDFIYLKC